MAWSLGFQSGFYAKDSYTSYQEGVPLGYGYAFLIWLVSQIYLQILMALPKIINDSTDDAMD